MPSPRSLLIAFFSVVVGYFLYSPPTKPAWLPSVKRNQTHAATGALVIGISLTASYGTVSSRQDDGSFEDIGRLDGDQAYLDMMQRFSLSSSAHPAPPYNNGEDMWDDMARQWLRSSRKLLFLPASSDVRTLSTMASSLISLAKARTQSISIASVVIAYPALPGLYAEDISDTAAYLSLPVLKGNHFYPPRTLVAAYAGYGIGLCSSYLDKRKCRDEGLEMPVRKTILVDYSSRALSLNVKNMRRAYDLGWECSDASSHFFPSSVDPSDRTQQIRDSVAELLRRKYKGHPGPGPPGPPEKITVLLLLEGDDVVGVKGAVKKAVEDEGFEVEVFGRSGMGDFVAARGAAELAWRALELSKTENGEM